MTSSADLSRENRTPRFPELAGRVAVVTGAAKGIGLGITRRLLAEQMRVVLFDIDEAQLDHITSDLVTGEPATGSVLAVVGDVGRVEHVDHLFQATMQRFGRVDLLVNNAADLQRRGVLDEHQDLLGTQLSTNVSGPYVCSQRAAALMVDGAGDRPTGAIVNISSVGASRAHHRGLPYDVTKGAIDAMTRAMAVDLGPHGIRVNAVAPGVTRTEGSSWLDAAGTAVADLIPLRRYGTVDDIGAMVAFLASDDSSYVTGQVLYVDGGITAQLSPPGPHAF